MEEHPGERLIIHYLPPHGPHVNPSYPLDVKKPDSKTVEEYKTAYRHSLAWVLAWAELLIDELSGKVVVTSDHGEAFGEKGWHGHGWDDEKNAYVPEIEAVRKVPWFELKD